VQPGSDLARSSLKARWVLLVFGFTLLFYGLFVNRIVLYSSPPSGDQAFYLMVTMSIVQDGDFNLANNYANHDEDKFYSLAPHPLDFVGMSAPYPLPPHNGFTPARPPSEQYNFHWPGLSLLVAPAWVIGGLFSLWWPATVVFMCIIGALLATNIFLFAHEITGRLWIAVLVWAALAFSNPLMSYTYLIFSELTCGLLVLYAFRRLALGWSSNGPVRLLLIGLSIAYIPWVAWRCAPIAFGLGVYAAIQWWRCWRTKDEGRPTMDNRREFANTSTDFLTAKTPSSAKDAKTSIVSRFTFHVSRLIRPSSVVGRPSSIVRHALQSAWLVLPVAISIALLAWYNYFLFGKFLPNNQTPERGSLPIFFWPWQGRENLTHFVASGYGLLFDRVFGLLAFAPVYILAAVGIIAMFQSRRRSDRRLLFVMALVVLPYLGIIMSFYYWNGLWGPPARFSTTLVPLLAAPLAMSLVACNNWIYRTFFGVLSAWGFMMMGIMIVDPRRLWPANAPYQWMAGLPGPLITNPFPVKINLWDLLPAVDPRDDKTLAANTALVTIVSLAVIVLGYLLMTTWRRAQRSGGTRRGLALPAQGATWAIAFALVGASWYFTNFTYLQPTTVLTEVGRINATVGIEAPRGITYLNGNVYVTGYESRIVGVFNLANKSYTQLQATLDGQPVPYTHPGDIKTGPDGNLYLLNNGTGDNALLEMKPDGTVIKKIALNNKTPVAAGLQFGPDGKMYVADVVGGAILKYNLGGGDPITHFAGKSGGFNNVLGVLVTPDGNMFAAESSNSQVQELDPSGHFVRAFQLGCQPYYMAQAGDWIDVSCLDQGIVSINTKSGNVQLSRIEPPSAPALISTTGMTYGPDGKLYVMDGSTLVVYSVQH
jgi:hypothetical protein